MIETPGRSLWADTLPATEVARPAPPTAPLDADVVIVGAGYTGLWTAWYLTRRDPTLRVTVLEREHIGFGASGRNGGWCSALLPMSLDQIARRAGPVAATRFQRAMHDAVDEVERFVAVHADASIFHRGGTISVARSEPQRARIRHEVDTWRRFGFGEADYRWLDAGAAAEVCAATGAVGAMFTPHCAVIHPARLVHALAHAVLDAGVTIAEGVDVHEIRPGAAVTSHGSVTADVVLRATEGYTSQLAGERRTMLPLYSLMIATAPLPDDVWAEIGLSDRPTFHDGRHLIIYGQRTADGRIAFGGRGAPYHFASRIRPEYDTDDSIRQLLVTSLRDLFPATVDAEITHHWGGVLGATRDWNCAVRFDRRTGLGSAGGYVGDGVSTSNLAGRTLAALVTDAHDDEARELIALPWVGHRTRRWEPEPLRWLGVNGTRSAARLADRSESRSDRRSRIAGVIDLVLGR